MGVRAAPWRTCVTGGAADGGVCPDPIPSAANLDPLLSLLLPTAASAGWGDESWGVMVWGAGAPQVPAMTVGGVVAEAALVLGLSHGLLAFGAGARSARRCTLNESTIRRRPCPIESFSNFSRKWKP